MPYLFKLVRRLSIGRIALAVAISACGSADSAPSTTAPDRSNAPAAIIVSPDSAVLMLGDSMTLRAAVFTEYGDVIASPEIAWSSSDSSVVLIETDGTAIAVDSGISTVTATSGRASRRVRIATKNRPVADVRLNPTSLSIKVGQSAQIAATLYASNGKVLIDRTIHWSSDRPAVASVDQNGGITAHAAGTATIAASSESIKATVSTSVVAATTAPHSVSDLRVVTTTDSSFTVAFTEVSDGADNPASYRMRLAVGALSWNTAIPVESGSCAPVIAGTRVGATHSCVIRGLLAGTSYNIQIRAFRIADGGQVVFGDVSNVARGTTAAAPAPTPVASVSITPGSASVVAGASIRLSSVLRDAHGNLLSGRTTSWMSDDLSVARVSSDGTVTGISIGTATISATSGTASGQAAITVTQPTTNPNVAVLFYDDFESGGLGKSSNGVRWTGNAYVDVSSAIARSGTRAARFKQGAPEGSGDWAELRFGGLPQLKEVFIEFYLYMPDGSESPYVGPRVSVKYPGGNDKFFRLWAFEYSQPPEVGASTWSRSGGIGALGREYFFTRDDGSVMGMGQGPDELVPPLVPFIIDQNKGRWVQVRIRAKVSGPDNRSGVIQMWADGVLVGNDTALHNYPPNGHNNFYVNGYLLGWANSGFLPGQKMYVDDVTISTGGFR